MISSFVDDFDNWLVFMKKLFYYFLISWKLTVVKIFTVLVVACGAADLPVINKQL